MKLAGAASLIALAACAGSGHTPPAADAPPGATEAVWTIAPPNNLPGWTGQAAFVMMSTAPGLCARASVNAVLPGEKLVTLEIADVAGSTASPPTGPGSYEVPIESFLAPKSAWMETASIDAHCTFTGTGGGRGGTVDITAIAGDTFTGSYDVRTNGGSMTGSFTATRCPGLDAALQHELPSCQSM